MNCGWVHLSLYDSKEIECLVDTRNHSSREGEVVVVFSELRTLMIKNMEHLEALYHGVPSNGLFEKLEKLRIESCPVLTSLLTPTTARSLVRLQELQISNCERLKHIVVEQDDNDSEIRECQELKQIVEENNNLVSPPHAQPCFPKLVILIIRNCNNLIRLFSSSSVSCNDLPSPEVLMIDGASTELEELIEGGGKVKVELPKLKLLLLMNLSSLCQEIELLPTLTLRVVHNCPKLSLTSSVSSLEEFEKKIDELEIDFSITGLRSWQIVDKVREILESDQVLSTSEGAEVENSNEERASISNDVGTTSPIDDNDSGLKVQSIEGTETTSDVGQVPPSPKPITPSSLEDKESTVEPNLMDQRHELEEIINVEDEIKESVEEEDCTSEDAREAATSAGIEGNGLGAAVAIQTETENSQSKKMQNEMGEIGGVCKDNSSSHLVIAAESEGHPITIEESEDDDPVSLVHAMEKDGDGKLLLAPFVAATEDNLVVKAISELEESLKMPLKDIASSDASVHSLLTALKFLSQLPLEDATLSGGLKAVIDSLHREFPSILCSFKQAFAAKEMKQQLLEVSHKWSALCSQFELSLIAARSTSSS